MQTEYLEILREFTLKEGVLTLPRVKDYTIIAKIGNELRYDLLRYQVPHWKAIGIKITTNHLNPSINYISKVSGLNKSYAELYGICEDLIFTNCSREIQAERIKEKYDDVTQWSFAIANVSEITSSNNTIFYEGCSIHDTAEAVIQNIKIAKISKENIVIHFLLKYGQGDLSFEDTSKLIEGTHYIPVAPLYDLNKVFSIKMAELGDKAIYLNYKRTVNELAIEKILKEYIERN